jgi:hypothetical protein
MSDTITVINPRSQRRPLAVHSNMRPEDAEELIAAYLSLGYPSDAIEWLQDAEDSAA